MVLISILFMFFLIIMEMTTILAMLVGTDLIKGDVMVRGLDYFKRNHGHLPMTVAIGIFWPFITSRVFNVSMIQEIDGYHFAIVLTWLSLFLALPIDKLHHHAASTSTITQLEEQLSSFRIRIEELQSELETAKTEDTASRDVILKLHDEIEAERNESTCFKFQVSALSSVIDAEFENKGEETVGLKQQVFKLEAGMQEKDTKIQRMGDAFEYEEFVNKNLKKLVSQLLEHNT